MIRKILREIYLLPRGEQRALLLLALLLITGIVLRLTVQLLPDREPSGMDEFVAEARAVMAAIAEADSLERASSQERVTSSYYRSTEVGMLYSPGGTVQKRSPININRADSADLLPLPGIGPVFAGRIVKYRELLGGFAETDQLKEVYGLKEETVALIRELLFIDTSAIRKLRLDSATFSELLRHPYLQLEDVRALVQYRDFTGGFRSLRDLEENMLLSDSVLKKIGPYLRVGR